MSQAVANHSLASSQPPSGSPPSVPTLDELYEWTSEPDHRVVIPHVDWAFYEQLVDSMPEWCHLHVDYDGINLEVMCLSPFHHHLKGLMGRTVSSIAEVGEIPVRCLGQTTWKRREVSRGLQADDTFFFRADKLDAVADALDRRSNNVDDYPNPDLAIEVDISPSKIDHPGMMPLCRSPRSGDSTAKSSKSSSSDWLSADTYQSVEGQCVLANSSQRSAGGWLRRTQAMSRPGHANSVPGLGLNWSPVAA